MTLSTTLSRLDAVASKLAQSCDTVSLMLAYEIGLRRAILVMGERHPMYGDAGPDHDVWEEIAEVLGEMETL